MKDQELRRANLRRLIAERFDRNASAFARAVERSQSQISDLLAGRKPFGEKFARAVEAKIGVSTGWLDQNHQERLDGNIEPPGRPEDKVPLISWVQAGDYQQVIDNLEPGDTEEWISTTVPIRKHTYALRVVGDSMEPRFPEGSIIIVEPTLRAEPGHFVIVRNGDHEATFKQLIRDGGDWFLKPLNPRYPVKPMPRGAVVCGVVRQVLETIC